MVEPLSAAAAGNWSATGSMSTARREHTATLLPTGTVLVAGGFSGSSFLASAELYDSVTGTWSATDSMTTARYGHTATLLPTGKVLVAGGVSATILQVVPDQTGTIRFTVQHHWVVEAGDTIYFDPVDVLAAPVGPGVFGATAPEPLKVVGGTGRFQGASGSLTAFGAARLFEDGGGETIFRYRGEICFAAARKP